MSGHDPGPRQISDTSTRRVELAREGIRKERKWKKEKGKRVMGARFEAHSDSDGRWKTDDG